MPISSSSCDNSAAPGRRPAALALAMVRRGRPLAGVAARRAIVGRGRSRTDATAGRFTPGEVNGIVGEAFVRLERQVPGLPAEPTTGARQNVILAALTLSLLEALVEAGVERGYAIELVGDVCWRFYRHWGRAAKAGTRLISSDPTRRLRLSVGTFLTYPFGRPGYEWNDVPQPDGRSLDMLRCPVAEYLGRRDAADLCAGSWCNLDYALAEMWGARLKRSGTLVAGAGCCDFRFHALPVDAEHPGRPGAALPMSAQ